MLKCTRGKGGFILISYITSADSELLIKVNLKGKNQSSSARNI